MKIKEVYVALDGMEFDNPDDCIFHDTEYLKGGGQSLDIPTIHIGQLPMDSYNIVDNVLFEVNSLRDWEVLMAKALSLCPGEDVDGFRKRYMGIGWYILSVEDGGEYGTLRHSGEYCNLLYKTKQILEEKIQKA